MRVLHVSQPVEAGVARCVADLATAQHAEGWDVAVACPPRGDLPAELADAGVRVLPWQARRGPSPSVPAEVAALRALLRRVRPDVVHLHASTAMLAGRLAVRGRLPTVAQPHAWSFQALDGGPARLAARWERWAGRWTDRVVCVSEDEARTGQQAGVAAPATVVHNGVDAARFPVVDDEGRRDARRRLGVDVQAPLAVCVGRLSEQKGQDVLLEAWPEVLRATPGAVLALVGDGPRAAEVAAAAAGAGGPVVLPGRAEPAPWYAAADVVVVPSRWEGMALVPLEASCTGRSVVVTDVGGARASVPAGTGAVVPVQQPAPLAAAVAERLGDPARADAEGARGAAFVRRQRSLQAALQQVSDVYAEVLAARAAPRR